MEKAVLDKGKSRLRIHTQDVCCAAIALLLGSIASPYAYMLVFIFCAFAYIRSTRESTILVFFVLLMALSKGVLHAYLYALGFTCFFIIVHMIRLVEYNLYDWISGIVTLILIPYSLQQFGFMKEAIILPMLTYVLMRQLVKEYHWIQNRFVLPDCGYALVLFAIFLLLCDVLPAYTSAFSLILFAFMAVVCEPVTLIAFFILAFTCLHISWIYFIIPLILCITQKQKAVAIALLLGLGFYTVQDPWGATYFGYCLLLTFVKKEHLLFYAKADSAPMISRIQGQGVLKRQMLNYASIFHSLAEYYAAMSSEESELLATMADALRYNADVISKSDQHYKERDRIMTALEGYQYVIDDLQLEEPKEGFLQLNLDISNVKRGEIKTTLKPLLEALLHRNLEVDEVKKRRFMNGFHVCLSDAIPFQIDALADSVKNAFTSNGDTFSIFRFRQSLVCMISDGMGNGARAQESSRLITSIFQRMMISGITQDSAIKCINKLIQNDIFATLDVLCFNYGLGVAYISKSAACPTYLLRNHKIYEISGNALPVGIVSVMQPDCFSIKLQDGDEFIMMSDGIDTYEFYEWMRQRKSESLDEDIEIFKHVLEQKSRKDDSTYIIANICAKTG